MMETLGALMNSESTLKIIQVDSGRAPILGLPLYALGGDTIQTNDNIYTLTPEINKTLSSTPMSGKTTKEESDILMMNMIKIHSNYTRVGDKSSKRKTF